jgi:alpha-L-fucosidase
MKNITIWTATLLLSFSAFAQSYTPAPENLKARDAFQDAKFGLFIHWGVYSVLGDGEWVLNNKKIPHKDYEKIADAFNPTQFDAAEWVSLAKAAGMKYITITSKHHDGFAMWDSKVSDWDIMDKTPYKKDVLKMLSEECKKQGIKLCFYHSHLDWHQPDYFPFGRTGTEIAGRKTGGDFNKYLDYMDAQLTELLTNYGDIGAIWFDGWWDHKIKGTETRVDWRLRKTYDLIHKLQPACMVGNNHHVEPFEGEDFQMFEKDLPGGNTAGHSADSKIGNLPLETCETMNNSWGFNVLDSKYKSTKALVHYLVRSAGHNANFLLNVGPMSNGKIQPEFQKTLREMGDWLKIYGETIYGTRGIPAAVRDWGVMTEKGGKTYVHILKGQDPIIAVPTGGKKVKSAQLFKDKTPVKILSDTNGMTIIQLAKLDATELDTVVELSF